MPLAWPQAQPDPTKANTKDADTRSVLLQEYGDRGQWARHYSTVRMTLGTFFITAATGVITVRWDTPQLAIAVIAGVIFAIGMLLFMTFSALTFREMNAQYEIVDSYRDQLLTPRGEKMKKVELWKWGTGLPIALLFLVAFASFDAWWFLGSKGVSGPASQITVPMKVQVGQQPEVIVNVPIKVSVP